MFCGLIILAAVAGKLAGSMMVVMALVTTFMTTPLLAWIYPRRLILAASEPQAFTPKPSRLVQPREQDSPCLRAFGYVIDS